MTNNNKIIGFDLSTNMIAIIDVIIILIKNVSPPIVGVPVFHVALRPFFSNALAKFHSFNVGMSTGTNINVMSSAMIAYINNI